MSQAEQAGRLIPGPTSEQAAVGSAAAFVVRAATAERPNCAAQKQLKDELEFLLLEKLSQEYWLIES